MVAKDRNDTNRYNRPPITSQHSSSVPSTPAQHPRDLRFPSRSPSPSRGLNHHSPRSAVSEAPGQAHFVQRGATGFCKFETGAEFRKRRIPYKDGGNDPLPPPKTSPKKTLEPDEDDKLSGDMRELYDRLLPSQESEERRSALVTKLQNILKETWPGNDINVNVFGSSGNLLSSTDSDVDLCITTPLKSLESMHSLATVLHEHGMVKVICRASARVPIVKFWDPELELNCDMNVNNPLALENTRMIKTYVQIDDRVRPLAKIIKHWTKRRILNDAAFGGTISSYTWICMIMNFLQSRKAPILPSLQKLPDSQRSTINGEMSSFADDLDSIRGFGKDNTESLGHLLFHFFRFYGYEIDYQESVVSVREGRVLSRKEKGWDSSNYHNKEARSRLCVEEPFNTSRNLGNSADDYAFSGIHEEMRRAFDLIAQGKLEECCEEYEFPPEEKPLFQRPPPKPKPTLTRSASQTGRSHANSVGAKGNNNREGRSNRTTSNQRNGSRRASSGTSYGNMRWNFMSPPVGVAGPDYFGTNTGFSTDQLHEQLYKQYQFLQAQQEALRSQLLQQQQAHAQAHVAQVPVQGQGTYRPSDYAAASPRQRQFANNFPNSHLMDNGPSTAPLLPGYLYHYPARYPVPASPLAQTRSQDGSGTSPSSPAVTTSLPSLRRNAQRNSTGDQGSTASIRSQSQPGRSFPNPVTLQGLAHPGYDVSGAIGMPHMLQHPMQIYQPQQHKFDSPTVTLSGQTRNGIPTDTAMPKEYVGYYVGQSPQLGPQWPSNTIPSAPLLQDVPVRHKRLSPERLPPIISNGLRRQSRSPSPLSKSASSPTSSQSQSVPLPQIPFAGDHGLDADGPVIVNGSSPIADPPAIVPSSPIPVRHDDQVALGLGLGVQDNGLLAGSRSIDPSKRSDGTNDNTVAMSRGSRDELEALIVGTDGLYVPEEQSVNITTLPSPRVSPSLRGKAPARLNLSPQQQSQEYGQSYGDRMTDISPIVAPPILSPVAELRTPSPTSSRGYPSPRVDVSMKSVQVANGRLNEKANLVIANGSSRIEDEAVKAAAANNQNQWQQPKRKGHKKAQSLGTVKGVNPSRTGGEALPVNAADRKGG